MNDDKAKANIERQRWIDECQNIISTLRDDDAMVMCVLRDRLDCIIDEMEDFDLQHSAEAECNVWTAMFRDVFAFPPHHEEQIETVLVMLYDISEKIKLGFS